jgi:protease-4
MSPSKSPIRRLFDLLWGIVSTLYRVMMVLSIVVVLVLVWMALRGGPAPTVEDNVALVIWPSGDLVEQIDNEPGRRALERISGEPASQTLLRDLVDALEIAADDPRITTAVLKLDTLWSAGMPQIEELVAAMRDFQAAGKVIHAYGPDYDQTAYLAASAADDVSLDPMGSVFLQGFDVYGNYFKDALDKLGVDVHVFRVGEYKAAVEPFIRNDMSEEAKLANREWLGDLWKSYGAQIVQSRKLKEGAADQYVSGFGPAMQRLKGDSAAYAKEAGLVTHLEPLTDFRTRVAQKVGLDEEHGSFRQIHFQEYLRAVDHENQHGAEKSGGKLALVVVQGEIVDGPGEVGQAGGETIADLLDQARRDKDVAGVVLRIDSPGGSAWASEQIRRAVDALRAVKKPVVASMSSVAASGGYWVAMDADRIYAHESTVTGSIGIFGLIPTVDKPLERLGVHTDGVGTTELAGSFRMDRPLSPQVAAIVQAQVEKGYQDFITGVSKGRKLPLEKVETIAEGRVWSGADAKTLGLVDEFGGLEDAAAAAAKLAGLEEGSWELEEFAPESEFPIDFLQQFFGLSGLRLENIPGLGRLGKLMQQTDVGHWLGRFNDPRGIYAHCFCTPAATGRR